MNEITNNICRQALDLKYAVETGYLELGRLLKEIKETRAYEEEGMESWGEFLMEMRLSESSASKMIKIFEVLVLMYQVEPLKIAEAGGWTVVYDVLPMIKDKESADEWIDKARIMTRSDIKKTAQEAQGKKVDEQCDHEWRTMCTKCGMIYEE